MFGVSYIICVKQVALLILVACFHYTSWRPLLLSSYTQNGLLGMLDRNRRIKPKPERFQECDEHFDIIITCEERVYDQVIEGS